MRRALSLSTLFALALVAGCAVRIPDGRLSCDPTTPCPPGFSCVGGLCYAAAADTGVPIDMGMLDADGPDEGVDAGIDSATDTGPQPDTNAPDAGCGACTWGCAAGGTCDVPTHVFVGPANTCVTTRDSRLFCWGDNGSSQLGPDASGARATHPVWIRALGSGVDRVAIGASAICARTLDGAVYCAGDNAHGQMGTSSMGTVAGTFARPVDLGTNAADDVVGLGESFCARVHDTVYCWGSNAEHQLASGDATFADTGTPHVVQMDTGVGMGTISGALQVAAASQAFCAAMNMGIVKCWGGNMHRQASAAASLTVDVATLYAGISSVEALAGGAAQMVGWNGAGDLVGWGNDLGPMPIAPPVGPPGFHVTAAAAGRAHVCVLGSDGHVYCMGDNTYGQTTGMTSTVPSWVDVTIEGVASIASGMDHTCAVGTSGNVWCWGRGDSGQIGNGTMDAMNRAAVSVP